jgi:hypothetical protein
MPTQSWSGKSAVFLMESTLTSHGSSKSNKKPSDGRGISDYGGVMASVLISSAVDRGFEPWSGQTKDYKISIYCFSAKHTALRRKSKDGLAWNLDNVSQWGDMSTLELLFQ